MFKGEHKMKATIENNIGDILTILLLISVLSIPFHLYL